MGYLNSIDFIQYCGYHVWTSRAYPFVNLFVLWHNCSNVVSSYGQQFAPTSDDRQTWCMIIIVPFSWIQWNYIHIPFQSNQLISKEPSPRRRLFYGIRISLTVKSHVYRLVKYILTSVWCSYCRDDLLSVFTELFFANSAFSSIQRTRGHKNWCLTICPFLITICDDTTWSLNRFSIS